MRSTRIQTPARGSRYSQWQSVGGHAVAAFLILFQGIAWSQDVSPLRLKAFLIWNIAKYTAWPPATIPAGEPFRVCVIGNAVVADALQDTVEGRRLLDRQIVVWQAKAVEQPPSGCQVLFVSGVTSRQLSRLLTEVGERPVLSISDIDGSADLGVIVQFHYEGSQLGYRVQLDSAKRARLDIGRTVLRLSK